MDRDVHARYLSYREAYSYFAKSSQPQPQLDMASFEKADAEQQALEKKGHARTDEEEARFVELTALLFRD